MMRLVPLMVAVAVVSFPVVAATHRHPARPVPVHRDWSVTVVATPEGGARIGNPAAPVKVIEYGSRTCPHCARFDVEGLPALRQQYVASGQVSYEFRDYPVHGALDLGPILIGRCVAPAQFFPMLGAMMAQQQELLGKPELSADQQAKLQAMPPNDAVAFLADYYGYVALAAKLGLPAAKARACLADRPSLEAIAARTGVADKSFQVASTPTFIINGQAAKDVHDWAGLEPALRAAGAK